MEQPLLIMNYQRYLFGNTQTCLISISSSGCSEPFPVLLVFSLLCNILRSIPHNPIHFASPNNYYIAFDFIA